MAVMCAISMVWTVPAAAVAATPRAELSIEPPSSQLSVTFVASSTGFPAPVTSYTFRFSDGTMMTTQSPTLVHTFPHAGGFVAQVTESDGVGDTAKTTGLIDVATCSAGSSCTKTLVSGVIELRLSGNNPNTAAAINLFIGTSQISGQNCETAPKTNASATDNGFTGNLTLTVVYQVGTSTGGNTTCFSSTVQFTDTDGNMVNSGKLPNCSGSPPTPPCVMSISTKKLAAHKWKVTKKRLIPPGDPTVGSV